METTEQNKAVVSAQRIREGANDRGTGRCELDIEWFADDTLQIHTHEPDRDEEERVRQRWVPAVIPDATLASVR